jgi:hypothetical protein
MTTTASPCETAKPRDREAGEDGDVVAERVGELECLDPEG